MSAPPQLFSLCVEAISTALIHGCDYVQDILELPSDLVDSLAMNLPPLALQTLHEISMDSHVGGLRNKSSTHGRKHGRCEKFNLTWKVLFQKRWPQDLRKIRCLETDCTVGKCAAVNCDFDWQQLYWEKHLQDCLDGAAETALLPGFYGLLGELRISDSIMDKISRPESSMDECRKLSQQCDKFGSYARYLKLQNVLCVGEMCELLRASKLQKLTFVRVISQIQVEGVCMLINQHRETLLSLEFIHCQLCPKVMDKICSSIYKEGSFIHGIQQFSVKSSRTYESKSSSISAGLLSFLSSGRSLGSLSLCDTKMQPRFAKMVLDTLLGSSCGLHLLEISENNISGWLSEVERKSTTFNTLSVSDTCFKSLSVLNLRGDNLHEHDAADLCHILIKMPNLRSLDISDNPITDDGIRYLIPFFVRALERECPLSSIKIENCHLSSLGVTELLRSFPSLKEPLNMLSVADNDLGSSVAATVAKFLSTSGVRDLNLEGIGLGALGFQKLEEEMPRVASLSCINIGKNRGGIRAAYFLSKLILQAPNVRSINAGANIMPPESLEVIFTALKVSKGKLEQLDLTGNNQLCQSNYTSEVLKFHLRGKPVVIIPLPTFSSTIYDDDP